MLKYDALAPLPPPAAGVLPIAATNVAVPAAAGVPAGVGGIPAAALVAPPQMQLAPFQPVDAGAAAADDAAGPIAEEDAHGLDADLAGEP